MSVAQGRVLAGRAADFPENSMHPVRVAERNVLLVHQNGRFYAIEDRCTHDNGVLHDGELLDGAVKCGRHGAKFNLETGKPTLPAVKKIRLYETVLEGEEVYIVYQEA